MLFTVSLGIGSARVHLCCPCCCYCPPICHKSARLSSSASHHPINPYCPPHPPSPSSPPRPTNLLPRNPAGSLKIFLKIAMKSARFSCQSWDRAALRQRVSGTPPEWLSAARLKEKELDYGQRSTGIGRHERLGIERRHSSPALKDAGRAILCVVGMRESGRGEGVEESRGKE